MLLVWLYSLILLYTASSTSFPPHTIYGVFKVRRHESVSASAGLSREDEDQEAYWYID